MGMEQSGNKPQIVIELDPRDDYGRKLINDFGKTEHIVLEINPGPNSVRVMHPKSGQRVPVPGSAIRKWNGDRFDGKVK